MIKYQARVFEFSEVSVDVPPIKISLAGFKTEVKTIEIAGESAKALDDFQYQLCRDLENKTLKEQVDKETWTKYVKTRFAANALVLAFRQTLVAFEHDPGMQNNLDNIIKDIQRLVGSLSKDIDKNYDTRAGHDAISTAIIRGNFTDMGRVIDEGEIDKLLSVKFEEFKDTQSKILRKITNVENIFKNQIKLNLLYSNIELITSQLKVNPGNKDCWIRGYFTNREIKSRFDARRPITDEIIASVEKNSCTIFYGDAYAGKTILLKRIVFELIQRDYVVLYADNVEAPSNLLLELLQNVAKVYDKIAFIADNVHKKSSETVFRVYNELERGKVKFLFAARERQLDKNRPETNIALNDIPIDAQYKIAFDRDYALLLFNKAIDVTFNRDPNPMEVEYSKNLYDYSKNDPLMFNIMLSSFLETMSTEPQTEMEIGTIQRVRPLDDTIEEYMTREIDRIQNKIGSLDEVSDQSKLLWKTIILSCLVGTTGSGLNLNLANDMNMLNCIKINPQMVRRIADETFLLNYEGYNASTFSIRHERIAYEFLSIFYKDKFNSNSASMDGTLEIKQIIDCFWQRINVNTIIDLLSNCSLLYENKKYRALVDLIVENHVVPVNNFSYPHGISTREKTELLCYGLGNFYLQTQDYHNAIAYYDKVILELDKDFVMAYINKGSALHNLGNNLEAIKIYEEAIRLDPVSSLAYNNKGNALADLGRKKEALEAFDHAIKIDPNLDHAYHNKGILLADLGKKKEALEAFDHAIKIDPNFPDVYYNRGVTLSSIGKKKEALNAFDQAIRLDPAFLLAYYNKGNALADLGRRKEALEVFDQVIKIDPSDAAAYISKGTVLLDWGKTEAAVEAYDRAIKLDPKSPHPHYNKGIAFHSMGKNDEALSAFDRAIEIDRKYAIAYNNKGNILRELGKPNEALAVYEQAITIDPNDALVFCNKGDVLLQLNRTKDAIEAYDRAIEIDPDFPDFYYKKGDALYSIGEDEEADKCYDKATELQLGI